MPRLTCYLMTVVPRHLPGAVFYADVYRRPADPQPLADDPLRVSLDPQVGPANDPNPASFSTGAIVADANGVGTIEFRVVMAGAWSPDHLADHCLARRTHCELRTGPDGEVIGV